jgi:predicted nucleotidyltransferase
MTDFKSLLRVLAERGVEFILVGGVAATVHGATRLTLDVDVVYRRSRQNIDRLVLALTPSRPYLRGAPPGLPFRWDTATVERGLNFTLTTDVGDLDLLGEIVGGGTYEELLPHTIVIQVFGLECRCLDLPALVRAKRASGRPKDLEAVAELEAILEERLRAAGEGPPPPPAR